MLLVNSNARYKNFEIMCVGTHPKVYMFSKLTASDFDLFTLESSGWRLSYYKKS